MGLQGPAEYALEEEAALAVMPSPPIEPLFEEALAQRPELLGSKDRVRAAEEALRAAKAHGVKVAVTFAVELIVIWHWSAPSGAQLGEKPPNVDPPVGAAVSVTSVLLAYCWKQSEGQLIPDPVTVPVPLPMRATDRLGQAISSGVSEFPSGVGGLIGAKSSRLLLVSSVASSRVGQPAAIERSSEDSSGIGPVSGGV